MRGRKGSAPMIPDSPLRPPHRKLLAALGRGPIRTAAVLAAAAVAAVLIALVSGSLSSRAVQNPSISLDMVTAGNSYVESTDGDSDGFPDPGTNHMTVGTINNCLTTAAPGNTAQHNHTTHLIIQNAEDLIGWQVRFNYRRRPDAPVDFQRHPLCR